MNAENNTPFFWFLIGLAFVGAVVIGGIVRFVLNKKKRTGQTVQTQPPAGAANNPANVANPAQAAGTTAAQNAAAQPATFWGRWKDRCSWIGKLTINKYLWTALIGIGVGVFALWGLNQIWPTGALALSTNPGALPFILVAAAILALCIVHGGKRGAAVIKLLIGVMVATLLVSWIRHTNALTATSLPERIAQTANDVQNAIMPETPPKMEWRFRWSDEELKLYGESRARQTGDERISRVATKVDYPARVMRDDEEYMEVHYSYSYHARIYTCKMVWDKRNAYGTWRSQRLGSTGEWKLDKSSPTLYQGLIRGHGETHWTSITLTLEPVQIGRRGL